jgi:hypothetical protein
MEESRVVRSSRVWILSLARVSPLKAVTGRGVFSRDSDRFWAVTTTY